MGRKLTYEEVKAELEAKGYTLLSKRYTGIRQILKTLCPNKHTRNIGLESIRKADCGDCIGSKKFTIEFVREEFAKKGCTLLSKRYIECTKKLDYLCDQGHKHSVSFNNFRNHGVVCVDRSKKKRLSLKEVRKIFKDVDYTLLTKKYTGVDQQLDVRCDQGHIFPTDLYHFKNRGQRCPDCASRRPIPLEEVIEYLEEYGYTLLSGDYKTTTSPIVLLCDKKKHEWPTNFHSFKDNGSRCPDCQNNGSSQPERELFGILKGLFPELEKKNFDADIPTKPHIHWFQLDILNMSTKRAIEYDGEYHHSEKYLVESKTKHGWPIEDAINYHTIKDSFFLNYHDLEVLHIKGDDWNDNKQACIQLAIAWLNRNCSLWPKTQTLGF